MKKSNKNLTFSSKIGLIAATVGSAVGLGNIWRFPAVAQANGGGAFLIIYIGCVILLGIPVMLSSAADRGRISAEPASDLAYAEAFFGLSAINYLSTKTNFDRIFMLCDL